MKEPFKKLNLTQLEEAVPQLLDQARREQWTYETFLARALAAELSGREQKAITRRLKAARIPSKKTLDGFDLKLAGVQRRFTPKAADTLFLGVCFSGQSVSIGSYIRRP